MSGQYFTHAPSHITQSYHNPVSRVLFTLVQRTLAMRLVILQIELAVCASLLNFVLLALESGPLYLFSVSYFIIIIYLFIYLFILYVLCDGETQGNWDTLDFMQVTVMIEWG